MAEIYKQGLEGGISTFNTECPSFEEWDASHIRECRYTDSAYRGKGIGTGLVDKLVSEAKNAGIWSIYSAIISINTASIALHRKCGFREIGYRERIAKDR